MAKGLVTLCYQKLIDASSTGNWDRLVFEDTYKEYFMQAQQFDQQKRHSTFQEIVKNNPKAEAMHYLVSTAAIGYIRQLDEKIPEVTNSLGKLCLSFTKFKFEIIQSHIRDIALHKIAIHFYSEPVTWIDAIGNQFIFSPGDQLELISKGKKIETQTISFSSQLSIVFYQERVNDVALSKELIS
jgi:hypothetical protein